MTDNSLHGVAHRVVARARQQGHVAAQEVREELARAGLAEDLWKDVLALSRASLSYRDGRYCFADPLSERVRAEQSQQSAIQSAVSRIIDHHQSGAGRVERRERGRVDFVQTVKVLTEDGREFTLLTRDLSQTGLRLVGTRRLLGQKVHVFIPSPDGGTFDFLVRILWTCPVGEDLIENGGAFVSTGLLS